MFVPSNCAWKWSIFNPSFERRWCKEQLMSDCELTGARVVVVVRAPICRGFWRRTIQLCES